MGHPIIVPAWSSITESDEEQESGDDDGVDNFSFESESSVCNRDESQVNLNVDHTCEFECSDNDAKEFSQTDVS